MLVSFKYYIYGGSAGNTSLLIKNLKLKKQTIDFNNKQLINKWVFDNI